MNDHLLLVIFRQFFAQLGVVSTDGHKPSCKDPDYSKFFTMAPMCRYAEDLPLVLRNLITDPEKEAQLNLDQPVYLLLI